MGIRRHIDTACIVDRARFLVELFACGVNFRLRLIGREVLGKIGRAGCAQIRLPIPADLMADPMAA